MNSFKFLAAVPCGAPYAEIAPGSCWRANRATVRCVGAFQTTGPCGCPEKILETFTNFHFPSHLHWFDSEPPFISPLVVMWHSAESSAGSTGLISRELKKKTVLSAHNPTTSTCLHTSWVIYEVPRKHFTTLSEKILTAGLP